MATKVLSTTKSLIFDLLWVTLLLVQAIIFDNFQ